LKSALSGPWPYARWAAVRGASERGVSRRASPWAVGFAPLETGFAPGAAHPHEGAGIDFKFITFVTRVAHPREG